MHKSGGPVLLSAFSVFVNGISYIQQLVCRASLLQQALFDMSYDPCIAFSEYKTLGKVNEFQWFPVVTFIQVPYL